MRHKIKLLFGYDNYVGDVAVCPSDMLMLLREEFPRWLYQKTWDAYPNMHMTETEFHLNAYESTAHYNDEDFYFDPKDASWLGFRVDLEQPNAECEFVFTTNLIAGEIRPDFNVVSAGMLDKLTGIKSTINQIISNSKRRK